MAGLADITPKLTTLLDAIAGIVTVADHVPEIPPAAAAMPAIYLDIKPPVMGGRSNTRTITWPIDILLVIQKRGIDAGATIPDLYPWVDTIIAALDDDLHLGGVLSTGVKYADPAVSAGDSGDAFGLITWKEQALVGTYIHALFEVSRVGGF